MDYTDTDPDLGIPTGITASAARSTDPHFDVEYEVDNLSEPNSDSDSDLDTIPTMMTSQGRILVDTRVIQSQSALLSQTNADDTSAASADPDPTTAATAAELATGGIAAAAADRTRPSPSLMNTQSSHTYPEYHQVTQTRPTHPESAIRGRGTAAIVED